MIWGPPLAEANAESRLAALRRRWEEDKGSPVFLPLAEEYRRVGKLSEALAVLEAGLQAQPNYLSALVALGRCRLEAGNLEGAVSALERVVAQDPAQLVAAKLLVEGYLRLARREDAQQRLDLYAALNDRDPEIATLQRRIDLLAAAPPPAPAAEPPPQKAPPAETVAAEPSRGQVFRLETPAPSPPDLARRRRAESSPLPSPPAPVPQPAPVAVPAEGDGGRPREPFPGLAAAWARGRYEEALAGMFAARRGTAPAEAPPPRPAPAPPVRVVPVTSPEVSAPPLAAAPPPAAAAAVVAPSGELPVEATATLGELYLRQGHEAEAEEIFRAVLRREPGDAGALQGLEEVRRRRRLPVAAAEPEPSPPGLTSRRAEVLGRYLTRLRRGAERHVS